MKEMQKRVLSKKIDFAEEILSLGKNRIKSFNYQLPSWDHENISGLEKRLKLSLGLQHKYSILGGTHNGSLSKEKAQRRLESKRSSDYKRA